MKVFLRTFGCRANKYDTEAVRAMLCAAGIEETDTPSNADFAVFNSCTVTAAAEADLRAEVRRARRVNPALRSVVMGCAAGLPNRDEAVAPLATLPGVEAVVPGADVGAIAAVLGAHAPRTPGDLTPGKVAGLPIAQTGARALLRIQEGCDEHCTFCATTIARGVNRSRAVETLVAEALLLSSSHPEIVLTGIHIGSFGRDIGSSLGELVATLIDRVPVVRFRLSSVEATEVDDVLAAFLGSPTTRLAPHLHAPLQSGSDSILRRMGRHWYNSGSYADAVRRIVGERSVFALSADVITGFPGESEADHSATMLLVESLPFTALHVFPWSPRPGTAALRLGSRVSGAVARRRARELRELAAQKAAAYASSRDGQNCDVVVTARGKGLTEDYLSVSLSDPSVPRRSRLCAVLRSADGQLTAYPAAQHD